MPKFGTTSRPLPYPTIEDGNLAFPKGEYNAHFQASGENGGTLHHRLEGARLIQKLIDQGKAEFACLVSAPGMGYRELQRTEPKKDQQKINWDLEVVGNQVPMLVPVILYTGNDLNHKLTEEDDVAEFLLNQEICIPRGARLAKGCYLRHSLTISDLFVIRKKENMKPGSFTVKRLTQGGFFRFGLYAHPDVFYLLQRRGNELCESIYTHAMSGCFSILKNWSNENSEDQWTSYPNLVALSDHLRRHIGADWSDIEFDPIKAATELRPIKNVRGGK